MRAVIQRVVKASVSVSDELVSSIGRGVCVLIGITHTDTKKDIEFMVRKLVNLRLFDDENGVRWKHSVKDKDYEILCVSQFTLYSVLKGNKPDYHQAMGADKSETFYRDFLSELCKAYKPERIKDGLFGANMQVHIENDGPVTIQLDSPAHLQQENNTDKEKRRQEFEKPKIISESQEKKVTSKSDNSNLQSVKKVKETSLNNSEKKEKVVNNYQSTDPKEKNSSKIVKNGNGFQLVDEAKHVSRFLCVSCGSLSENSSDVLELQLDDGRILQGLATIMKHLARQNSDRKSSLLGNSTADEAGVSQWLEYRCLRLPRHIEDKDAHVVLQEINSYLADRAYLVNNQLSLADVVLYRRLHSILNDLAAYEKQKYVNVCRWFSLMQHVPGLRQDLPEVNFSRTPLYTGLTGGQLL